MTQQKYNNIKFYVSSFIYIYIYIYIEREREREREREKTIGFKYFLF